MEKKNVFVKSLVSRMTLEQKVGAVMTLAFNGVVPKKHTYEYITKYHCGGLRLTPSIRGAMSYVDPRIGNTVKESHSSIKNLFAPQCSASDWSGIIKIESTNTKKSDIIKTERKVF